MTPCCSFVAFPALEQHVSVPEPEVVREITPALESETPVEEVHDHTETALTEAEDEVGPSPVENTTAPVIEEPESPMIQSTPAANVHEPEPAGEAPKKHSYASIVSELAFIWTLDVFGLESCFWNLVYTSCSCVTTYSGCPLYSLRCMALR